MQTSRFRPWAAVLSYVSVWVPSGPCRGGCRTPRPPGAGGLRIQFINSKFSRNGKGEGNVPKLGRSGRERARTEETEYAHPAVPTTGPGEAQEVLPEPFFVFDIFLFFQS